MNRLRNKLIVAFLAATVIPLAATVWITTSLLDRSLTYSATKELDDLSKTLEQTAREFYQHTRQALKADAASGRVPAERYLGREIEHWPNGIREFWDSGEAERFALSGSAGDHLEYMVRRGGDVWVYSRELGNVRMDDIARQYRRSRELVSLPETHDLRRGLIITLVVLVVAVWVFALLSLVYLAHRISSPIQQLTGGLSQLASGNLKVRLHERGTDETGLALRAFNNMADQLEQSRDRLIYLTQIASWQMLARKMAHELKNSLTPIRLTVEEIAARQTQADRQFMDQAVQIVVEEIETLERRVRAFSEFSSEPTPHPAPLDINSLVQERIALLRPAHAEIAYSLQLSNTQPQAFADGDQVKGILTNLLENAAEAAGAQGRVLIITSVNDGMVFIEVHDSGPGLSEEASRTLFEPAITFKKHGMGLGLSIARKSALLNGGDITVIRSELGGAAFRIVLPKL